MLPAAKLNGLYENSKTTTLTLSPKETATLPTRLRKQRGCSVFLVLRTLALTLPVYRFVSAIPGYELALIYASAAQT